MNEIVSALQKQAQDLVSRIEPYNQWQQDKQAAIDSLVDREIGIEKAASLVEELEGSAYQNLELERKHAEEMADLGEILLKTASYIEEIQVKLDSKEAELQDMEKAAAESVKAPSVEALAETGRFDDSDIANLKGLDEGVLEKLASHVSLDPVHMGSPADHATSGVDPLTQFCLS